MFSVAGNLFEWNLLEHKEWIFNIIFFDKQGDTLTKSLKILESTALVWKTP